MASPLLKLVGPALDAARRVLRDLDADQVPSDVRKVAAHSGALTPPLATGLLRALDRYDWLRAKAFESLVESAPEGEDPDAAFGRLFLERPPGWSERIAAAAAAAARGDAAESELRSAAALADLERDLAEARNRLREQRRRADRERARLIEQREEARSAARSARGGEQRAEAAILRRAEQAEASAEALRVELEATRRELAAIRSLHAEERRRRAGAEHSLAEVRSGRGWPSRDPETLALHLDDAALMARPGGGDTAASGSGGRLGPLRLAPGVAPDSAAAIDWLLELGSATTVLVDGYNAGFALAGPGDPSAARRRLHVAVDRLPTLAAGPLQVLVVYDSSIEQEDRGASGRVKTCFAPPGRSADEEILSLVSSIAGAVVVISDDRVVRERADTLGALTLWSAALVDWAKRR